MPGKDTSARGVNGFHVLSGTEDDFLEGKHQPDDFQESERQKSAAFSRTVTSQELGVVYPGQRESLEKDLANGWSCLNLRYKKGEVDADNLYDFVERAGCRLCDPEHKTVFMQDLDRQLQGLTCELAEAI